jgi:RNA polymerase sigma-70 factor (ECF subfamily)
MSDNSLERDEWLMGQVAAGRADRMEPLVRRYGTPLLTFIRRMVGGDVHRSEELFQEAFLAVWAKRAQYRFPMPFKPWLYRIAVNKCRAAFRVKGLG